MSGVIMYSDEAVTPRFSGKKEISSSYDDE